MDKVFFNKQLIPTDVRIYYEDDKPYLDYTGIAKTDTGNVKVHLPKIDLVYNVIEDNSEYEDYYARDCRGKLVYKHQVKISQKVVIKSDKYYDLEIIEREMTKEQIEKELGYKVKIVED